MLESNFLFKIHYLYTTFRVQGFLISFTTKYATDSKEEQIRLILLSIAVSADSNDVFTILGSLN